MNLNGKKSVFQFLSQSDIVKIAVITVLVFIITNFMRVTALMTGSTQTPLFDLMHQALSLPSSFAAWLKQPWSVLTYMFSAEDFISLLFDLIWLWIFGTVIEDLKGPYRILPIYLIGGILGGIGFMLMGQLHPASAGVYYLGVLPSLLAVVTATIIYRYDYAYWFYSVRIPIWVLGAIFFIFKIGTLSFYSLPILALILGGILAGLFYNFGGGKVFDALTALLKKIAFYGSNDFFLKNETKSKPTQKGKPHADKQDVDAILDKINQKGIQSLTAAEKKILESFGK